MKKLMPSEFHDSFTSEPEKAKVVYLEDGHWEARCAAGVLSQLDGQTGFVNLSGLLSMLAGAGVHHCMVEWAGLPAWHFGENN